MSADLIKTVGIGKYYRMGEGVVRALDGISLTVQAGEYVAIVGQSGSGKSTLMNILGCLDRPDCGQYYMNGREVAEFTPRQLAKIRNRYIGFVFQNFNLLPFMSAAENVALPLVYAGLGRRERERRAAAVLERVGMADRMEHRPGQLSGGQCQRVAIARALVADPALILADEPTGNLDSASGQTIMEIMAELHREGRTILLITHEPELAGKTRRRVRIADGRLVEDTRAV
ncbi:MAG: ABC transporter ATP-binding protein [Negativicutes bacterium]|nr:ABC transporter ATP-binding protein [Negativicutes bacterium]